MSATVTEKTTLPKQVDPRVLARIGEEGYGPGAWHGADMKAALSDVTPKQAFWRPAPGRHNIAEIALHHAYCARSARAQVTGAEPEPFVLEGDDWFALPDQKRLAWPAILAAVEDEHQKLAAAVSGRSALSDSERFGFVLGVTCHASYHAGQVQLLKRLQSE